MSHYESSRGCWMFKPPSTGKQGGLLAAINKLSKSWSKRWVWVTHDALHYAPRRPTNARSEDNVVHLDTVLDAREVDAKFMMKKGVPPELADNGWCIRTDKKDILLAAPDPDTRDRIVTFFAKYRAWSRIGQPTDEEDGIDFLRTQLFHDRSSGGDTFSETSSSHFGSHSVAGTDVAQDDDYWDEIMADEGLDDHRDGGGGASHQRSRRNSVLTNTRANGRVRSNSSVQSPSDSAATSPNQQRQRSETVAVTPRNYAAESSKSSQPLQQQTSVSSSGVSSSRNGSNAGSHQDLESLSASQRRGGQPTRSGTPPLSARTADTSDAPQRRRAAAQTMNFGRSRPDNVVKIAESARQQQSNHSTGGSASSRSGAAPVSSGPPPKSSSQLDDLDEWDDVDGTIVAMKSSAAYKNDDGHHDGRGDQEHRAGRQQPQRSTQQWPSEGPIERISETQQLLREKIAERNRRRANGGGLPALSLGGLTSDNYSELGSASPSPRAFALLLQRKPREYVTTTRCAELNRTPLVLPLESVEEFSCLIEDVTFLDRHDHVIGRACGTTEGLVLRKTGAMDDARFATCAKILFQCERLHPQLHEPTHVVVESSDGTQTTFSTEFGAYVIAQVTEKPLKK